MMDMPKRNKNINLSEILGFLLIMLVLFESIMNKLLITVLPINNVLGYLMLSCSILVIITNKLYLNTAFLIFYIICCTVLLGSVIVIEGNPAKDYVIQFFSFGSCGIVCAMIKTDIKKVFYYGSISTIVFLIITFLQGFADAKNSAFNFGYALIPGFISTFYIFFNSWKKKKQCQTVLWMCIWITECVVLIRFCSRGNLIQVYVFTILSAIILFRKKLLGFIGIIAGTAAVVFIRPIIIVMYNIMVSLNIFISVIWKNYWLITTSDQSLLHGRTELYDVVWEGMDMKTALFGHGVGAYEMITGTYVHNIFLQIFYETGLIGLVCMGFILFVFVKMMFSRTNTIYETELYIMVFVLGFVKLCFSSVHWRTSVFWFMVMAAFKQMSICKKMNVVVRM